MRSTTAAPVELGEGSSLFASSPAGLSDAELAGGLQALGRLASRVEARRAEFIAEADRPGVACRHGFATTTAWLISLSGDPAAVCRSRLAVARSLQEMPQTRAAFTAGEVPETRVRLLAEAHALAPDQFARDESRLVSQATAASSARLPQVLAEWRRDADAQKAFSRRALRVSPSWSGMVHLDGDLDPEGGSVVLAALRSLSENAALDPRDARTPQQCRADALVEICRRHLDGDPPHSRRRPHLTVTVPWQALEERAGVVDLEGGPVNTEAIRRLACDASLAVLVEGNGTRPAPAGPTRRVVPPPLRRALDRRDGGCTHPGCDTPARWCDAHHIVHWADGGPTEAANLRLLRRRHHRAVHEHRQYPARE